MSYFLFSWGGSWHENHSVCVKRQDSGRLVIVASFSDRETAAAVCKDLNRHA